MHIPQINLHISMASLLDFRSNGNVSRGGIRGKIPQMKDC